MTAPHQDARVEDAIRAGSEALAEVAIGVLPSVLRTLVKPWKGKAARALELGVRELLGTLGVVTGKVHLEVGPDAKVSVKVRR